MINVLKCFGASRIISLTYSIWVWKVTNLVLFFSKYINAQSYSLQNSGPLNDRKLSLLELDGYTLRRAVKQDCEAIHWLVQELANHLNMPDAPQINAKALEVDGFGSRRFYEGFVAESHELKQVVGYAIYYFSYSTWQGKSLYMEDMYIRPEDRKNRIAVSFFHLISQAALNENCMRLNFCVLKNNKPAVELFQSLGANDLTTKEGWHYYRIPRHGIEELAQPTIITKLNS